MQANSYIAYNRELKGSFHRDLHFQQKNLRGLLIGHADKLWHTVEGSNVIQLPVLCANTNPHLGPEF